MASSRSSDSERSTSSWHRWSEAVQQAAVTGSVVAVDRAADRGGDMGDHADDFDIDLVWPDEDPSPVVSPGPARPVFDDRWEPVDDEPGPSAVQPASRGEHAEPLLPVMARQLAAAVAALGDLSARIEVLERAARNRASADAEVTSSLDRLADAHDAMRAELAAPLAQSAEVHAALGALRDSVAEVHEALPVMGDALSLIHERLDAPPATADPGIAALAEQLRALPAMGDALARLGEQVEELSAEVAQLRRRVPVRARADVVDPVVLERFADSVVRRMVEEFEVAGDDAPFGAPPAPPAGSAAPVAEPADDAGGAPVPPERPLRASRRRT